MIARLGLNRLSSQLYLGISGAVAFTLVAALVAWLSFDRVGDVQGRVDRESIPALATAFAVARQSGVVVAAGFSALRSPRRSALISCSAYPT